MTTHTHPEILEEIQAIGTHIAATEDRLRADMYNIKDELQSDVKNLQSDMKDLKSDVKAIKDSLLPPKP